MTAPPRLVFSSRLEELADALAGDVAAYRTSPGRLLETLPIAVSDRSIARYLELNLARRHGIAVNLRFPFLGNLLAECLAPPARARLLDRRRLVARLAAALGDSDLLSAAPLAPVRRYLEGDDGRRRAELATELAGLLADYGRSRPQALVSWRRGEPGFAGADPELEGWQRALWIAATRTAGGPPLAALAELYAAADDADLEPPAALFAVGLERFAAADRLALERLAARCPVHLYAFNPCAEFWEDAGPGAPGAEADESLPLASWGRAGRAAVRHLGELASFDFEARFPPADESSVLGRIQSDIVARRPAPARPPSGALGGDDSLRIAACPGIRRELEHVAESIWQLVRRRPELRFNDLGVLLAGSDRDLYRAQVSSVFAELGDIPHHVLDVPLLEESRVAEAASWLLGLPGSGFSRPAMTRVLTHPRIGGGDDGEGRLDWPRWIDQLGIFFGAGPEDHRGTYLPGDVFHWDQGLLRLALGSCMRGDPAERPVTAGGRTALPLPVAADRRRSAGHLALLARSLIADCRHLETRRLSLDRWGQTFGRFIAAYVEPAGDRERLELGRVREALASLGDRDEAEEVPLEVARELAAAALAALRTRRGEPLLDGVMVAPLGAAALIDRAAVFVCGVGEQTFPAAGLDSPLDLRAGSRRADEPSARDRDRYWFLQACLAARDALHLSFVGRDLQTGEPLGPSSVALELRHVARPELADPDSLDIEVPTWSHADPGVERRGVDLAGRRRRRAAALGSDERRRPSESRRRALSRLRQGLDEPAARLLGLAAAADGEETEPAPRDLSTTALARFLESPVDAWLTYAVGVRSFEPPDVDAATEPLDLGPLAETLVARGAVCEAAIRGGDLEGAIARQLERLGRRGTGPAGVIAEFHGARAAELARRWWRGLEAAGAPAGATALAVGRAAEGAALGELLPPLFAAAPGQGGEVPLEIHGAFPLVSGDAAELVYFDRQKKVGRRRILRGLVDHLVLAAAGRIAAPVAALTLVGAEEQRRVELASVGVEAARAHLELLAGDLLGGVHAYLLPGEAVIEAHERGLDVAENAARRAGERAPLWAPPWRDRAELEVPENAEELAMRRLGPLLARVRRSS